MCAAIRPAFVHSLRSLAGHRPTFPNPPAMNIAYAAHAKKLRHAGAPLLFVFLWSTGFIGAKYGLPSAEPLTFLAIRMAITTLILGALLPFFKVRWPARRLDYLHIAIVGLLIHGVYLGGVFAAIHNRLPASVTAIIMGLQPLVTVLLAACWLREPLSRGKLFGLALGFAGVVLVVGHQSLAGGGWNVAGIALCCIAVTAISVGTTYQKKFCGEYDLLATVFIQFMVNALCLAALALALESRQVHWDASFIFALAWLVLVLSVGASFLLLWLIRHGEAGKVGSLFYLVPPLVAVEAWALFGETLGPPAIAGIIACMAGVAMVIRASERAGGHKK